MIAIDIETYSETDLTKAGVYRYALDPKFEILLFGYSFDGKPVEVIDLAQGEQIPKEIIRTLLDDSIVKSSFNAMFERICLSRFLWDIGMLARGDYLSPRGWHCDMVWAGYMGFPMSLKDAGKALGLEEQKMTEGKELIRYFCVPCAPTKVNKGRTRNYYYHAPDKWLKFKEYNKRDVEVELSITEKLKAHPVPECVWHEYHLDQEINDRGISIDVGMVENAIKIYDEAQKHTLEKLKTMTGLENPRSVVQMQSWLRSNGIELESLGQKELAKESIPEPYKSVLTLWQQLAMSAVKKYQAMDNSVCPDGRLRGMFRFYGANRTGRFCLAEGTPVLVKNNGCIYEKPIEDVTTDDLVFDGENWVHHDGVVFSGDKEVISWDGIVATPEHKVFIDNETSITLKEAKEKRLKIWRGEYELTSYTRN